MNGFQIGSKRLKVQHKRTGYDDDFSNMYSMGGGGLGMMGNRNNGERMQGQGAGGSSYNKQDHHQDHQQDHQYQDQNYSQNRSQTKPPQYQDHQYQDQYMQQQQQQQQQQQRSNYGQDNNQPPYMSSQPMGQGRG
jgi:hypothetical protein